MAPQEASAEPFVPQARATLDELAWHVRLVAELVDPVEHLGQVPQAVGPQQALQAVFQLPRIGDAACRVNAREQRR